MLSKTFRGSLGYLTLLPALVLLALCLTACADSTGLTPIALQTPTSQGGTVTAPTAAIPTPPTTGLTPNQNQAHFLNAEGEQLLARHEYELAQAKFKEAVQLEPDNPVYLNNLALSYLGAGEPQLAEEAATKATGLDPSSPLYHNTLGLVEARLGKPQQAAKEARLAVTTDGGKSPVLWLNLSSAEYALGHYAEAEDSARKATQLDSKQPEAWLRLGNALEGQGRHTEAIQCFKQAIALNPTDPVYLTNLGNAYLSVGDKAQARAAYEKALALDPNFQPAKAGLDLANS